MLISTQPAISAPEARIPQINPMREAFSSICRRHLVPLIAIWFCLASGSASGVEAGTAFADSHIARLAAQLQPGEFRAFVAGLPPGVKKFSQLLGGRRPDGTGAPAIDTWTDSGQWDPQRKRAFFQGLRQSNRFLSYDAATNAWKEISLDKADAPPLFEQFGHLYGRTALDWKLGHYYRLAGNTLHRYLIDEDRWEKFENSPIAGYISIDWHYGLDMLVAAAKGKLHGFRDGRWTPLGNAAVHGYHSSAKYNPKRRDMLFIGGNDSPNSVDILTADGQLTHMRDAPFTFGISSDDLTHDPVTGNYLVLHRDHVLWEYNPDLDEWRVARDMSKSGADWPFGRHGGIVPIVIDELGIILWNHGSAAMVYRHKSVFSPQELARAAQRTASTPRTSAVPPAGADVGPDVLDNASSQASETRSATVHRGSGNIIESEARTMQPGEWRNIAQLTTWPGKDDGHSFKKFQYVSGIDGAKGGADGMGWTQNLVYHKGKLMLLLMRGGLERALMAMEADGRFWRINQPEGFDQKAHRRPFNKLTRDDTYMYYSPNSERADLGRMIRTRLDKPGTFEPYGIPIGDSQILGQFAATYVPDWRRFYAYTPGGKIWSWAEGETSWTRHGEMPEDEHGHRLSGYAGLLLWNPVRKELVISGGQNFGKSARTSHKVYRLTSPLGSPEMLEDRRYPDGQPMPWGSGSSKLFVDPRDGSYIVFTNGVFYRNHCAGGTFEIYQDLRELRPFGPYEAYAPLALVPGTDIVVFLSHIRGLVLHRLKPVVSSANASPCGARMMRKGELSASARQTPGPSRPPRTGLEDGAPPTTPPPSEPDSLERRKSSRADGASEPSELSTSAIRSARYESAATDDDSTSLVSAVKPAHSAQELSSSGIRVLRELRRN